MRIPEPEKARRQGVVVSEGERRANSENESVRNIGAGRVEHVLEIRLETDPLVEVDLICCLEYNFVTRI